MKKVLFVILTLIFVVSCRQTTKVDKMTINVLQINDLHGHVQYESGLTVGLAGASYYVNKVRAEDEFDNTILIGNGDMFQETAISRVSYGKIVIDCMNQMKFDCMGIGNHEFDWGFDKILAYFDGDTTNGEANFPLLNSNIFYDDELLTADNVFSSTIIEKENLNVGIMSYIGNVYSSISANMVEGYEFKTDSAWLKENLLLEGMKLKEAGADIIIVNVHGGNSSSIQDYYFNNIIADLKYKDEYLFNAIINGHTHTKQSGYIARDGVNLPVIQSNGSLRNMGRIDLVYDFNKQTVTGYEVEHINLNQRPIYDYDVLNIINNYYEENKTILEEIYCENLAEFYRSNELYRYVGELITTALDTTAFVCNTGAFRNECKKGAFDFNALYALTPFDNHIIICEISGSNLAQFVMENQRYEICYTKDYGFDIATDKTYKLAIIDYVFFSSYFADYRPANYTDTNIILRDVIAMDLRLRKETGFNIYTDWKDIKISSILV